MVAQPGQRPDHKVARQHVANQTMAIYEFELPQVRDVMTGRVAAKKRRASFQPLGWGSTPYRSCDAGGGVFGPDTQPT